MKAILISIKPKWVAKILNGEKTLEIRKTAPKCELPIDVYIYCTKNKLHYRAGALVFNKDDCFKRSVDGTYKYGDGVELMGYSPDYPYDKNNFLNGKIVAKFKLRFVEKIYAYGAGELDTELGSSLEELSFESCVPEKDLLSYVGNGAFYWAISNLEIFDEPKELADFGLKRAPQSWFYLEAKE